MIIDEFEHLPQVTGSVPEDLLLELESYDNSTLRKVLSETLHILVAFGREAGYVDSKLYPYLNLAVRSWWILKEQN